MACDLLKWSVRNLVKPRLGDAIGEPMRNLVKQAHDMKAMGSTVSYEIIPPLGWCHCGPHKQPCKTDACHESAGVCGFIRDYFPAQVLPLATSMYNIVKQAHGMSNLVKEAHDM